VIRGLSGSTTEMVERGKTIFFPGDPAERFTCSKRGAVRLSRVYESGEEITVALLRENSLFGVLSLLTGQRSDRFYHSVAFTRVEMVTAPATSVRKAIEADPAWACCCCRASPPDPANRNHDRNPHPPRHVLATGEFPAGALPRLWGPCSEGITIDLRLSHQAIAEAIGSTRVTITRLLGDLRNPVWCRSTARKSPFSIRLALAKRFS
jgi:CRP-like cAMP-binding protein